MKNAKRPSIIFLDWNMKMAEHITTGDIQQQANELAEYLKGSCNSLPDWVIDREPEFTELLDELVSNCHCCGWWVGAEEADYDKATGETLCNECLESYEYD